MFRMQSMSVSTQTGRLDAQQNSRFAMSMLERELRVAGAGVADQQPLLVMANTPRHHLQRQSRLARHGRPQRRVHQSGRRLGGSRPAADDREDHAAGNDQAVSRHELHVEHGRAEPRRDDLVLAGSGIRRARTARRIRALSPRERAAAAPRRARARSTTAPSDAIFHYYKTDTLGNLVEISPASLPLIHTARDSRHAGRYRQVGADGQHQADSRDVHERVPRSSNAERLDAAHADPDDSSDERRSAPPHHLRAAADRANRRHGDGHAGERHHDSADLRDRHLDELGRRWRRREGRRAIRDLPPVVERRRRSTSLSPAFPAARRRTRSATPTYRPGRPGSMEWRRRTATPASSPIASAPVSFRSHSVRILSMKHRSRLRAGARARRARPTRHRAVRRPCSSSPASARSRSRRSI